MSNTNEVQVGETCFISATEWSISAHHIACMTDDEFADVCANVGLAAEAARGEGEAEAEAEAQKLWELCCAIANYRDSDHDGAVFAPMTNAETVVGRRRA